ncbi:MAG: dihydrofolate reductase family protein [Puniceicoccaceae bacterium]
MKIVAVTTISIDGRISPPNAEGTPFSSPETRENFFKLLRDYDAVITGRVTFDIVKEMMLRGKAHQEGGPLSMIITRNPEKYSAEYGDHGIEFSALPPQELVNELGTRGLSKILVAGGGEIYSMYARSGLVDEWICVVEPLVLGGGKLFMPHIGEQKLELIEHRLLNQSTILLHYKKLG